MGSGPRKYKIGRKFGDARSKDRISGLPDEVIGHILSFLPTKYAVATSALSSRWRNLYQLTTSLDFDDSVFSESIEGLNNVRRNTRFRKFVDMVLARCKDSHISKFKLKCSGDNFRHSLIRHWLKAACFHDISKLELSIYTSVPYCLPLQLSLSTCQNLVVLKLDSNFVICLPNSVTFPRLKMLFFKEVMFSVDTSLNLILSRCPMLEELGIEDCVWGDRDFYITNPLLKKLTLDDMAGTSNQFVGSLVYFDAPSLIYLKYHEPLADKYVVRNLGAIMEAHIEVCFNDDEFDDPQDLCDAMLDLVIGVSNCELLYLSGQCLEALTSGEYQLPIFHNLTRLELGLGFDVSWNDVLIDFLNNTPCLKALSFVEGLVERNSRKELDEDVLLNDQAVPSCVKSCLKIINIKCFSGLKEELDIIMYFLEHAAVLDKLIIHWIQLNSASDSRYNEEEISKLQKASTTCSISFR